MTQILDATDDIQRRVDTAEKKIAQQAETVQMQAILSHTDVLTALPNRRAFEAELERIVAAAKGKTPLCTVIFVDLDRFAHVNSEYGHRGGDVVLRQTASMLKEMLSGKDMVAHYGGDTFAVLLPQTTLHDALPMAEKIRKAIENTQFSHGSRPLHVTASLGIAQLHREEMMDADVRARDGRVGSGPRRRRQHLLPPRRPGVRSRCRRSSRPRKRRSPRKDCRWLPCGRIRRRSRAVPTPRLPNRRSRQETRTSRSPAARCSRRI